MDEELGKVERNFLEETVFKNLGATSELVLEKPGHGMDNAVIKVDGSRVLIVTSDPLSIIPKLGMDLSAWLTVHLLASDFTTSGVMPQFAVLSFSLPPEIKLEDFSHYFKALSNECKNLGISIVAGHTGKYPGCNFTIVGGGMLFGFAGKDSFVTPRMARVGDKVVITKGPAIATTGVLAKSFPKKVRETLGQKLYSKAVSYLQKCSTVRDAILCSSIGLRENISSMHDATEGGVLGGLYELSLACSKGILVEKEKIFVSKETRKVCEFFGLDPLVTLSEGTLIVTCKPSKVEILQESLAKQGIASYVIGDVLSTEPGLWIDDGKEKNKYVPPSFDPYWEAYFKAVRLGWE